MKIMSTELITSGFFDNIDLSQITNMKIGDEAITKIAVVDEDKEYTIWPLRPMLSQPKSSKSIFYVEAEVDNDNNKKSIDISKYFSIMGIDLSKVELTGEGDSLTQTSTRQDYGFKIRPKGEYVWSETGNQEAIMCYWKIRHEYRPNSLSYEWVSGNNEYQRYKFYYSRTVFVEGYGYLNDGSPEGSVKDIYQPAIINSVNLTHNYDEGNTSSYPDQARWDIYPSDGEIDIINLANDQNFMYLEVTTSIIDDEAQQFKDFKISVSF